MEAMMSVSPLWNPGCNTPKFYISGGTAETSSIAVGAGTPCCDFIDEAGCIFKQNHGKEMVIYKGRMWELITVDYDYRLYWWCWLWTVFFLNIFVLIFFLSAACIWSVAPGPKENRHLGSAISVKFKEEAAILQRNARFELPVDTSW